MTWVDDNYDPPGLKPSMAMAWGAYLQARQDGYYPEDAGRRAGIAAETQAHWEKHYRLLQQAAAADKRASEVAGDVEAYALADLCPQAMRSLNDFAYFRYRYFGRKATPWQEEAAQQLMALLETPEKEFVVVNCPPGSGKSTLFAHDIPLWMLVRNRALRCMVGSRTERQASQYIARLRRSLSERLARNGAEAALMHDFGSFRPLQKDIWRVNEFVVSQPGVENYGEKEPSFAAYGYDSAFLGGRFDLVVWDDLVDRHVLRTVEAREAMQRWYGDEAETRVEPAGLFILQGQRLDADDLYRYALNITVEDGTKKYRHIKYPAHDDARCTGDHSQQAGYWPDGCLLDPVRVPWRDLAAKRIQSLARYQTLYQQEDTDWESALVRPEWIEGGEVDGVPFRGCWTSRRCGQYPRIDPGTSISVVGVDPSPSRDWGITHWVYDLRTEERHLVDIFVGPLTATGLLDVDYSTGRFHGLMNDWQARSVKAGFPVQAWIIEINAAQKFLLQHNTINRWAVSYRTELIPHTTTIKKRSVDFGPQILAPLYRAGLVRLPGLDRVKVEPLVTDVLRWNADSTFTFDALMSQWFVECQLPNLTALGRRGFEKWKPTWMGGERGYVLK